MISIIDYGMGNIGSLENMIRKAGGSSLVTSKPNEILKAEKLILPGVGNFDQAIHNIEILGIQKAINEAVMVNYTPILCICLGAQLITESSQEGNARGFGWIRGRTIRFNATSGLRIPHMGWNDVKVKKNSVLFRDMPDNPCFYFVHSYYIVADDEEDVLAESEYGLTFTSAIERGNIFATQFHPEKSHKYGLCLIKNFVEMS